MAPLDDQKGIWKKKGTGKSRHTPKGRQLDDVALEELRARWGGGGDHLGMGHSVKEFR